MRKRRKGEFHRNCANVPKRERKGVASIRAVMWLSWHIAVRVGEIGSRFQPSQAKFLAVCSHDPNMMVTESHRNVLPLQRLHLRGVVLPFPSVGISDEKLVFHFKTEVEVDGIEGLAVIVAG